MKFKTAVREGIFLKRYKRFFADIKLGNEIVVAHVPNTGSMKGAAVADSACLITESDNPERKLKFTLEAVQFPETGAWVGVNTSWPNQLAKEAFENKIFKHWQAFDEFKAEVKLSQETRLDLMLSKSKTEKKHYVEIKNVSMAAHVGKKHMAQFPDAVTERGQKHLRELIQLVGEGHGAEILFAIQRNDCEGFRAAAEIDPEYAKLLKQAKSAGVKVTPALVEISNEGLRFTGQTLEIYES
jgi:sugar fermentation stimulation protein A